MKTRWGLAALGCAAISCLPGCPGSGAASAGGGERASTAKGTPSGAASALPHGRPPADRQALAGRAYSPHYVGLVPEGQEVCPAVCDRSAAWRVTRLFDGSDPHLPSKLPAPLKRYCRYDPTNMESPKVSPLAPQAVGCRLDPYVVSEQGLPPGYDRFSSAVKEDLRAQFRSRVDYLPALSPEPSSPVRFAVLDSTPTHVGNPWGATFDHGFNLASLIEDLTCPGGIGALSCHVSLSQYLALPRLDDGSTLPTGGDVGSPGDMATAINDAVGAWLGTPPASREPHLILNLSIAWEPRLWASPLPPNPCYEEMSNVQAVRDALRYAACNGALVLAAVGNDPDPDDPDPTVDHHYGSMCPARWEKAPPSVPFQCSDFGVSGPDPTHLLYAVGGLDPLDQPITSARRNGTTPSSVILPALNAPALLALDYATATTDPLPEAMSGSSVATAVAAAAAGLVWSYKPSASVAELIALLHDTGAALPPALAREVDPFFFSAAPNPTRISIKCAVSAAQGSGAPCTAVAPARVQPTLTDVEVTQNPSYASYDPATHALVTPLSTVGNGISRDMRWVPDPWVGPQPDTGQCGQTNCGKFNDPYVDIPVPDDYQGPVPVTAVDLRLYDVAGKLIMVGSPPVDHQALQMQNLFPGGHLTQALTAQLPRTPAMATLTFTVPIHFPAGVTAAGPTKRRVTQTILFHP